MRTVSSLQEIQAELAIGDGSCKDGKFGRTAEMQSGDIALWQFALVAVTAFCTSVIGGLTGYGTGLLLPPVLIPIIGAEAVVPVIALSAIFSNISRLTAFRAQFNRSIAILIVIFALPGCMLGAYGYTRLAGPSVMLLVGSVTILLVPARRLLLRLRGNLERRGIIAAASVYGVVVGGTTGSGIILLSILLAAGLTGTAVIATDAAVSIVIGLLKVAIFQATGALPASSWIVGLLIGACAFPGAFVARRLLANVSGHRHTDLLDAVVILGGTLLLWQGLLAIT